MTEKRFKKWRSTCWAWGKIGTREGSRGYVSVTDVGIHISLYRDDEVIGFGLDLTRFEARMLARRINECLEATK
jgi:hypothetical protein